MSTPINDSLDINFNISDSENFPLNWEDIVVKSGIYRNNVNNGYIAVVNRSTILFVNEGGVFLASDGWNYDRYRFRRVVGDISIIIRSK